MPMSNLKQTLKETILPNPRFIAIEGIDCAGKTTLLDKLVPYTQQRLEILTEKMGGAKNFDVEQFGAWEGAPWGADLRKIFVGGVGDNITEIMLAFAGRRALLLNKILPHLGEGNFAFVDRYVATTFAYQVTDTRAAYVWADLMRNSTERLLPGLTIYLDVPVSTALHRMELRNIERDSFESRGELFYESLLERFKMAFSILESSSPTAHFIKINASDREEAVFAQARDVIDSYLDSLFSIEFSRIEAAKAFLRKMESPHLVLSVVP